MQLWLYAKNTINWFVASCDNFKYQERRLLKHVTIVIAFMYILNLIHILIRFHVISSGVSMYLFSLKVFKVAPILLDLKVIFKRVSSFSAKKCIIAAKLISAV